jgi:glycosyltransferase involved in cell wall biosynthesis
MPNFVDCAVFQPFSTEDLPRRSSLRATLGIPEAAFVVGCVAAVKKDHKRIDYLIREFSQWAMGSKQFAVISGQLTVNREESTASSMSTADCLLPAIPSLPTAHCSLFTVAPFLLIAGAKTSETAELIELAESLIPGRYKIVTDCSRAQMPELYRAMDVFVLTSLFEMMPIALLEALASGLPCLVNRHPVLEWMVGVEEETADRRLQTADQREEKDFKQKYAKDAKGGDGFSAGGGEENSACPEHVEGALRSSRASVQNSSFDGGMVIDMSEAGALAQALDGLTPEWLALHGRQARERAVKMFSTEAVIGQYLEYYREIMGNG